MKTIIVVVLIMILSMTLQYCIAGDEVLNNRTKTNVVCNEDARGVTYCRDVNTGRTWVIMPSPVGTYIHS